jgi:type VI secretion system secreted protein VgrG
MGNSDHARGAAGVAPFREREPLADSPAGEIGGRAAQGALELTFAWEGAEAAIAWRHLLVASFEGTEAISSLYRYEIKGLVRAPAPEVDPAELVGRRATLRIATGIVPEHRVVHGVIAEAEEIGGSFDGTTYRLVLMPPLVRADHRRRSRLFLEKTTRQIVDAVLQGDPRLTRADGAVAPPDEGDETRYTAAKEAYTWRVADASRLDQLAARPYCVQYNETDLAFVSRLLEEEGIGYHFENGEGVCLLVLSDTDAGKTRLDPFVPLGPSHAGREVTSMRLGARLRPRKVSLLDYNWRNPTLDMTVERGVGDDLVDHTYPGGYPDAPAQGAPLAEARRERYEVEAEYATGEGRCRMLTAGTIFELEDLKPRHDGEYLVTRMVARGDQGGILRAEGDHPDRPYTLTFECARRGTRSAPRESRFRPARVTPRPRIHGSQTAFVTADPASAGAEINVGGPPDGLIGCVRVRFHWDRDLARLAKEPSSCWIRVSQVFAGAGEGAVWHPRVGAEVIVEYEEGNPDRPLVTGRVYNGKNLPPAGPPTYSTLRSNSSPGGDKHNELSFEDAAGKEQITLHAARDLVFEVGRDWASTVGRSRSEQIGLDSSSTVGNDRAESTGGNRTTTVKGSNSEKVGANETIVIGANQSVTVGANQAFAVGANQSTAVGGNQTTVVAGSQGVEVVGTRDLHVGGADAYHVGGSQSTLVEGPQGVAVYGTQTLNAKGAQTIHSDTSQEMTAPSQAFGATGTQAFDATDHKVHASSTIYLRGDGKIILETPGEIDVNATGVLQAIGHGQAEFGSDALVRIGAPTVLIDGGNVIIQNGTVSVTGSQVSISGGSVDVEGGLIKLN